MKNSKEELMNAYVSTVETEGLKAAPPVENAVEEPKKATLEPVDPRVVDQTFGRMSANMNDADAPVHYKENLGYIKLPIESLPTGGLFYPEGFEISIRAARGEEIKHWSTMNEADVQQISRTDDILNYMIERCARVVNPERPGPAWRDIKSVDRLYILLAIKEFTFLNGENDLILPGEDGEDIVVRKEMVDFINIPDNIKGYYNREQKCFTLPISGNNINLYIPSVGVNNWLKTYYENCRNSGQPFDEDFMNYAPLLIRDYMGLTTNAYEEFVASTRLWGVKEWSVLRYVVDALADATTPSLKYTDERGAEHVIPLSFPGGLRSLFIIPDPLRFLR